MPDLLTDEEKRFLLRLARESIEHAVRGEKLSPLNQESLTPHLSENGASFVTLTINGQLRGCIGALEAYQPLVDDVREHAVAAALQDPRFPQLDESELKQIHIEVSRLTAPLPLLYSSPEDLLARLNPHVDGVILRDGFRRATFLPQVWEQLPDAEGFLSHLCAKMGARANLWRDTKLQVHVYQVEEFHEMN
jgi:AmmeMemoRadiSam system protein A